MPEDSAHGHAPGPCDGLRVATLNLWGRFAGWPERLERLGREWPAVDADVVLLQEVCTDGYGDQASEVARLLGYPHVEHTEGHQTTHGSEGVAIVSRVPLSGARADELPSSDPPRRTLSARIRVGATEVTVICAHTVAVPESARLPQVAAILARREEPVIIGGDLNGPPDEVLPLARRAGLRDCLDGATTPTWPVCNLSFGEAWRSQFGRAPQFSLHARRLDYIFTRRLVVEHATVATLGAAGAGYASDHAAIWADVRAVDGEGAQGRELPSPPARRHG